MGNRVAAWMIASGVLASLALPLTVFRLWIRVRIQRLGWEDTWATVAFICGMANAISNWVYIMQLSVKSSVISMWIYMFTFISLTWSVRISIIFSIIRIIPPGERLHKYGLAIVAFFLLSYFAFLAQEAILCNHAYQVFQPTSSNPYFFCSPPRSLKFSESVVGCVADVVTVAFPLYVLRRANLRSREHRLLCLLFSSSLVISIACSIRTVCQLIPPLSNWTVVITNFQIATCLVICNILVVATYFYRVLGYNNHDPTVMTTQHSAVEKDDFSASPSMPQQMTLTTIDHLFLTESGDSVLVATDETTPSRPASVAGSGC